MYSGVQRDISFANHEISHYKVCCIHEMKEEKKTLTKNNKKTKARTFNNKTEREAEIFNS